MVYCLIIILTLTIMKIASHIATIVMQLYVRAHLIMMVVAATVTAIEYAAINAVGVQIRTIVIG